jgi:hypothetical protein
VIERYENFVREHAETFQALANRHTLGRPLPRDADVLAAPHARGARRPDTMISGGAAWHAVVTGGPPDTRTVSGPPRTSPRHTRSTCGE